VADQQAGGGKREPKKSAVTLLVEIAEELFVFGCVAEQRGGTHQNPGYDPVAEFAYATPKHNPNARRSLADIRPDLAAVYVETYGAAPSPTALGNAMTILLGKARRAKSDASDPNDGPYDMHGRVKIPADRGLSLVTEDEMCPLPDGWVVPAPYIVGPDGIHLVKNDGFSRVRVSWAWLFPVGVYVDPAGDQLVELAWRDRDRWVSRLIRRRITKSGRKLVAEAGDARLPVIEAEARHAERWLAAAEAANHERIAKNPVARQLGWQADGKTFVTGQGTPWRVEPRYPEQAAALAAHRPRGTLAAWKEAIAGARDYVIAQVGVYTGLAAPLLCPLRLDSFTVDFSGRSTRGKTIAAMAALSCWADPSDRSEAMLSWQTASVIDVEKRLNLVSGLTVVIDETRLAKDPALVDAILYAVPKNHGRPRGGGWPSMIPWRAIVVSTGEQAATSFTSHQGASGRVVSLQRAPFGTDGTSSRDAAEGVKAGIEANFGTAGPAFVAHLQRRLAEDGGLDKLRARHQELTELLRGGTDMTGRRAPLIASLALAAELAVEWEVIAFSAPDVPAWLALFASADPRDDRPEMALGVVREFVAARAADLWCPGRRDHPPRGCIGRLYRLEGHAKTTVALLPEKLREQLKRRGYELDPLLPGWREAKVLHEAGSDRTPWLLSRRLGPTMVRMLVFNPGVIDIDSPPEEPP
jgi:Domain of unknown function (DUF927)